MTVTDATAGVLPFTTDEAPSKERFGGKGASLVRMVALGLPVPPGFLLTTDIGRAWLADGTLPQDVLAAVDHHLGVLEQALQKHLGDARSPLLVSVRSGAPVSMPGMMDTVLNVGLNDEIVAAHPDQPFAWSSYARLLESYATIVRGLSVGVVEDALFDVAPRDQQGAARALQQLIGDFPQDPRVQIRECLEAVFRSWRSPRAVAYREHRGIDPALGTAAVVQAMVFGNRGDTSGSGVAFSRDPATGEPGAYGDVLFDAQGEDVVAGTADPEPLTALADRLPDVHSQLLETLQRLERTQQDLIECEFTIEDGRLFVLQYRAAQRSGRAAVRVAVDLVDEGLIDAAQAVALVGEEQLEAARAPRFAQAAPDPLARGAAASPGAATGIAVFDPTRAQQRHKAGEDVILVRPTTSPADVHGFIASAGIVTGRGGRTCHAAVVARGMGRPAVCGVGEVRIAADGHSATIAGQHVAEGDPLVVDGDRGLVARSAPPLAAAEQDAHLQRLEGWRRER